MILTVAFICIWAMARMIRISYYCYQWEWLVSCSQKGRIWHHIPYTTIPRNQYNYISYTSCVNTWQNVALNRTTFHPRNRAGAHVHPSTWATVLRHMQTNASNARLDKNKPINTKQKHTGTTSRDSIVDAVVSRVSLCQATKRNKFWIPCHSFVVIPISVILRIKHAHNQRCQNMCKMAVTIKNKNYITDLSSQYIYWQKTPRV